MDITVILTYDEAANITPLLDVLLAALPPRSAHGLVFDDSSPDGNGDVVREHSAFGRAVFLETRPTKDGLGNAYRHGFRWAHEHGYERVVQTDADGSHAPASVPALLGALGEADIAVGSRYVSGGSTEDWPLARRLISLCGNQYVRPVLGLSVRDATSGFRAYRTAGLASLVTAGSEGNGYCFQIESTWRATRAGLLIRDVPILFVDRRWGSSKMSLSNVAEAMWRVVAWRLARSRSELTGVQRLPRGIATTPAPARSH